ncbi:class I SAM-dependent methyltransferase [Halocalculus aciditolerans]|uniref:S-adenosylmethionine-dependent methyltransferase n=1 Tax=Halocalculus aciditolerans TaxID=1383812 RepID=A0A830FD94_9EURY|nr:methyltransferase domain-containing protein [Halocalculus aciditolerans]GGL63783.1 S-adenosylmethionine-dependent methyltransferase [Halocalculus aciditolerans]
MRRFSAKYLEDTRRGMWDDRRALAPLSLRDREHVVDVGCGSGELTRVLAAETPGAVTAVDADADLITHVDAADDRVLGDATRLPLVSNAADLVACQALLINLPDPVDAVREFARVSSDLVAAIEPDNSGVDVESTVPAEAALTRRARDAYIAGVETDVTLGSHTDEVFADAGLVDVETRRHEHVRETSAPYSESDIETAQRKATGARLREQRRTLARGGLSEDDIDALRGEWREMGREVVEQMQTGEYERRTTIPFSVTVGHVE